MQLDYIELGEVVLTFVVANKDCSEMLAALHKSPRRKTPPTNPLRHVIDNLTHQRWASKPGHPL
jgi:hypothetical protein